ncbi:MAG: ribonuclease HII [Candidatus Micrarchaeota archaeon]|nr:ribonuclease HII [Candidatus Micrarchaeota archaeon]MCX8154263.1 ribonuclease HII [Candidatus Micrarchaeota archaeon]
MTILGIDEAGRGALIGPLVVGFVALEAPLSFSVRDSKELSRSQRDRLFELIEKEASLVDHIRIEPHEIDAENINRLEFRKIRDWLEGKEFDGIYIDAFMDRNVLRSLGRYVIADYHADRKYPVVSAASIVAKVYRDRYIDDLHKEYGDFGSGYPSDPKTIEFIKTDQNLQRISIHLRKKWRTVRNIQQLTLDNL